jgi:Na+/melibiose symporter-like transporter
MSNLSAISVAVICLSFWIRAFVKWLDGPSGLHQQYFGTFPPTGACSFVVYSFLCIVWTFFCLSWRVLPPVTTKTKWEHVAQQWCSLKGEPTCLHYDYTSFIAHNGCPTCLDLAQYVVYVMSTRVAVWQITRILCANCPYFLNFLHKWDRR